MKRILLAIIFFSNYCLAQLPNGAEAPNFTFTDLNNQSHELYSYLDSGKTVFLDIFATWCGPCWNFSSSGAFEELYDDFGPNGTNEFVVLSIEADPTTSVDEIFNSSLGDWTSLINHPIIDDANGVVQDLYEISYYPTLFMICPDKQLTLLPQTTAENYLSYSDSCSEVNTSEYELFFLSMLKVLGKIKP